LFLPISWGETLKEMGRKTVPVLGNYMKLPKTVRYI